MTAPLLNHLEHTLFLCLLDCFCSLYNLQLLVLSKLACISGPASIATRVNNFKLLHLHATFATFAYHYATQVHHSFTSAMLSEFQGTH